MKKIFSIFLIIMLSLMPIFSGVNKNNAIVLSIDIDNSQNFQTWTDLDLSAYTSNKLGKCLLECEVIAYESDPTECVHLYFRPKGQINVQPIETYTRYASDSGDPEGTRDYLSQVEVWTDDDGFIQWYSDYNQPPNKTVTLQIKIMININ